MSQTMQTAAPASFMQRINAAAASFISTLKQLPIPILHRPQRPSVQIQADAQQRKSASVCGGSRLRRGALLATAVLTATFALTGPSQAQAEILSFNQERFHNLETHHQVTPDRHQQQRWNKEAAPHINQMVSFYNSQKMRNSIELVKSFKLDNLSQKDINLIKDMKRQIDSYNHVVKLTNQGRFGMTNDLTESVMKLTHSNIAKGMQVMDNYLTAVDLSHSISKAPPPPPKPQLDARQERRQQIRASCNDMKIMKENMDKMQRGQNFAHQPPPQHRGPRR